jgi:hypothetical protein
VREDGAGVGLEAARLVAQAERVGQDRGAAGRVDDVVGGEDLVVVQFDRDNRIRFRATAG